MEKAYRWHCPHMATWNGFTLEIHKPLKYSTFHYKIYKGNSPIEIPFLDLIIYIKGSKLYTRLHTKATDSHMYLNFCSEHPMSLKNSIPYSQYLRLKRIHNEPQHLLEAQYMCICSSFVENVPMIQSWKPGNKQIK